MGSAAEELKITAAVHYKKQNKKQKRRPHFSELKKKKERGIKKIKVV